MGEYRDASATEAGQPSALILGLNAGSSSLKAALYAERGVLQHELSILIEAIGLPTARMTVKDADGVTLADERKLIPNHAAATTALLTWLRETRTIAEIHAIGHRIVHGGPDHTHPEIITPDVLAALHDMIPLARTHLPDEIAIIEAAMRAMPRALQVACFDTAFHRSMPRVAQQYALPRSITEGGILRYGFHGLSYEYIVRQLEREAGPEAASGRVIAAHLGNGASMAAIHNRLSRDTTMGFTPIGGLVMSTRSGDLDPGLMLYLLRERGMSVDEIDVAVRVKGGLLGVSQTSPDMRDLLAQEQDDDLAAGAVALFCYHARKSLASLAAVLGGVDTVVFTGGIGEHASEVRWRICENLRFLGIELDRKRNDQHAPVISADGSPATVRVIQTNEEYMIALHTAEILRTPPTR